MTMYVYNPAGEPVGFVYETSIYDLDGTPLGRIVGRRVHHFDGTYAGEWFKDMVVRHPEARPRLLPPAPVPPRRPPGRSPIGCARWSITAMPTSSRSCAKARGRRSSQRRIV